MKELVFNHSPAFQVILPLLAAVLCILFGNRRFAWVLTTAASWAAFAIACLLLAATLVEAPALSYYLGGWTPPWGIEYRIDTVNAFVLFIVSGIGALVSIYARESIKAEIDEALHVYFYAAYLLCLTGLLGVTITGDAFNIFVFLEISSLSAYALVAMGARQDRRALTAAYNYLIMGTIGATFFVIGLGFLYSITGTLNIADLAQRLEGVSDSRTIRAGFVFIFVGMGLKLAMFPLHLWLPNAYTFAPSVVSVFLAATGTKVAAYVLLRFVFTVFGAGYAFQPLTLEFIAMPLALLAMFAASITAVFQTRIKRMLAYSSIAQTGYILLGVSFLSVTGLTGAVIHLFNHAIIKAALFMAVGAFVLRTGGAHISHLHGAARQMPWTCAAFVAGGLSLIGIPLTAGFISKWYLVSAALEQDAWWLALMIVLSSLIAILYVWRVVEAMYLVPPPPGRTLKEAPLSMLIPLWILVAANVCFGIYPELTTSAAQKAATLLLASGSTMVE